MIYRAIVTNRKDPNQLGRVKVKCQSLVGADRELPMWISPDLAYLDKSGACFFAIPSVDTVVDLIEIEDGASMGEYGEAYLDNAQYRYRPSTFYTNQPPAGVWKENYPDRYGYSTPGGHAIIFDDEDEVITVLHSSGNSWMKFEQDGKVKIKGTAIWIGESATESIALGDALVTLLSQWRGQEMGHTHTAPGGATGTPIYPGAGPNDPATAGLLSSNHKVES